MATRSSPKKRAASRGPGRASKGWTRTTVRIDRAKLVAAQRILGLATATETIDAALDAVTFREDLIQDLDRPRAAAGPTVDPDD